MDMILLIFGVPILLLLLCGWAQWFLVSHGKGRVSLVLPLLTGALAVLCFCKASTVSGWDSLAWGLLYLPWSCAALVGTLIGWLCGRRSKKRKERQDQSELISPEGEEKNDE